MRISRTTGLFVYLAATLARAADAPTPPGTEVAAPSPPDAALTLDVILVNDPDFPLIGPSEAEAILNEARAVVAAKLGFPGLSFRIRGASTVQDFLAQNAPQDSECLRSFEPVRVRPGQRTANGVSPKAVLQFLQRWKLDELRAFFPDDQQKSLGTYDIVAQKVLDEFDRKVQLISGFKLPNGKSLLAPETLDNRSYVRWVCAMREQDQADLVLTNQFILYDLASEPYPHSIFQKCKVGGASLLSPKRRAMRGRAMVASTFSMLTELPFFQEDGIEDLRPKERFEVIGAFIVAHELGHALFKLPDFYDHPKECLMTTKYETGYVSGFWYLKAAPGECPACAPWVDAKRHVFLADTAHAQNDWDTAIKELMVAIRQTPKHVDGNYKRYLADLSAEVARLYFEKGDKKEAARWVASVLKIAPDHPDALALQAKLDSNSPKNKEKTTGSN